MEDTKATPLEGHATFLDDMMRVPTALLPQIAATWKALAHMRQRECNQLHAEVARLKGEIDARTPADG